MPDLKPIENQGGTPTDSLKVDGHLSTAPEPLPDTALSTEQPAENDSELLFEFTEERRFQLYAERRKGYSEAARETYGRFHQTLVALAAGSVILSISFAKDIGHAPESISWLTWGWFANLAGGAAAFVALTTSGEADRERIKQLDCLATTSKCDESRANKLGTITVVLNWIATILCVLGISLLLKFAMINISKPTPPRSPAGAAQQLAPKK